MNELQLRYGLNPNQIPARVLVENGDLPFQVLNGNPGYINLLDALQGWQLVKELKKATGLASAASFKHVSPAGVGTSIPLSDSLYKAYHIHKTELSPIATAYARARGADRMSSYGDFISLSDMCDEQIARLIAREVSDGIIAPSYSKEALQILCEKKKGKYLVLQIAESYSPKNVEKRDIFGITFEQIKNDVNISKELFQNIPTHEKNIPETALIDLIIALVTLKYTQSNSVCYTLGGQTIGIGAGQQSRIHCVRLAGDKADIWHLRQHPKILSLPFHKDIKLVDRDNLIDFLLNEEAQIMTDDESWDVFFTEPPKFLMSDEKKAWIKQVHGVSLGSDAFFPFGDNIERASKSGVSFIAQAGGSLRDDNVIEACNKYNIVMAMTGVRLFLH